PRSRLPRRHRSRTARPGRAAPATTSRMARTPAAAPPRRPARARGGPRGPPRHAAAPSSVGIACRGQSALGRHFRDHQQMDAAVVGADHLEALRPDHYGLATTRHMAELVGNQPADGVELVVAELGAEVLVEVFERSQRLDDAAALLVREDVGILAEVVLEADVADELLDHILHVADSR